MTALKQWFPWNGSKQWLTPRLDTLLASWGGQGRFIEPFCGGGSVSALMRRKFPKTPQRISDANPWLVSAFQTQTRGSYALPRNYADVDYWRSLSDSDLPSLNRDERATRFAVCLFSAWGNRWKTEADGRFTSSSAPVNKHWIGKPFLREKIRGLYQSDRGWLTTKDRVRHKDWKEAVRKAGPGDLVYLDTPYPESLGYGNQWWSFSDQLDVIDWVADATTQGVSIVVSNMATLERLYQRAGLSTEVIVRSGASKTKRAREEVLAWFFAKSRG